MSHVTDVKLIVQDLDALEAACEHLGLELERDKRSFAWWGSFQYDSNAYGDMTPERMGKCDHAIKVKGTNPRDGHSGPWEIGVVKAKDGEGFSLYYDTYGGAGQALSSRVGPQADRLRVEYAAQVAEKKAVAKLSRHGWRVSREDLPTGAVRLRVRKR